jgi:regulator of chromosome condensation
MTSEPCFIFLCTNIQKGIRATYVAAGIDNSMAITEEGKLYAWGFSSEYRTGLGTEDSVETPTLVKKGDTVNKALVYVESHGQFSVAAGRSLN